MTRVGEAKTAHRSLWLISTPTRRVVGHQTQLFLPLLGGLALADNSVGNAIIKITGREMFRVSKGCRVLRPIDDFLP